MRGIVPPVNFIAGAIYLFYLIVNKVIFRIMHIQVIEKDCAAPFQALANGPYRIIVFPPGMEITE